MKIEKNCVVTLSYKLFDQKKRLIEDTADLGTLDYLHGHENIVPGLEKFLNDKALGFSGEVIVSAKEGYGEYDQDLIQIVPRSYFDFEDEGVEVGAEVSIETDEGEIWATIEQLDENEVTINANHPLAGIPLTFHVKVEAIREATVEEIEAGGPSTGEQH